MGYVVLAGQLLLGGIFLVSAVSKVWRRRAYRQFVSGTAALLGAAPGTARRLAPATVAAEAGVVLTLAVPATTALGFGLAAGLLAALTYVLVRALRRGTAAGCNCFGAATQPVGPEHVVRNAVLIGVALTGLAAAAAGGGPVELAGVAVTAVAAFAGVALVVRLDDLVTLFRAQPR